MPRYVLTGTAYAGKTTLLRELEKQGYCVIEEAARDLIERHQNAESRSLPWLDLDLFLVDLLKTQLDRETQFRDLNQTVFLDRSPIDQYAYFKYFNKPLTPDYRKTFDYNQYDGVFLLDTLPGYQVDAVRKEPVEMVEKLRQLHQETYQELGYPVIIVPVMPVADRLNFIIDHLKDTKPRRKIPSARELIAQARAAGYDSFGLVADPEATEILDRMIKQKEKDNAS